MEPPVLLVTGGSRGIGAEIALRAATMGWHICLTYRTEASAAERVVARIVERGGTATALECDVSEENSILRTFGAIDEIGRLQGLVANAGIVDTAVRVDALSAERVQQILLVNAFGAIISCREAVRRMSTRYDGSGGSIVLISSAASRLGAANQCVDYAASKAAVDILGIGLSQEVAAEGIRVNVVRPGMIDTDIHATSGWPDRIAQQGPTNPMGRAGTVKEVAAATLWFLGEESSYCTGSILDVAGGR